MGINEDTQTTTAPNQPEGEEPIVASRRRGTRPTQSPETGENEGFTEQWASTTTERAAQRQVEVQANLTNNPNRPEYRTVTTQPQPQADPQFEAEDSKFFL